MAPQTRARKSSTKSKNATVAPKEPTVAPQSGRFSLATYEQMLRSFRLKDLHSFLTFADKRATGKKSDLVSRSIGLIHLRNPEYENKIVSLYKNMRSEEGPSLASVPQSVNTVTPNSQNDPCSTTTYNTNINQLNTARTTSNRVANYPVSIQQPLRWKNKVVGFRPIPPPSLQSFYPINPDVKLKKLPFYEVLGELLKPSTLAPQHIDGFQLLTYHFCLTPQQAQKIIDSKEIRGGTREYSVQIQMRFCLLETTSEQEDKFPPDINVYVNQLRAPLPNLIYSNRVGVEPKRPSMPLDITNLCQLSPTVTNRITISWKCDFGRCYVASAYLVKKMTSNDLLQTLKAKRPQYPEYTKSLISLKLREDNDCEIATTSLRCSLLCPLGKMRMVLPCRAETCVHLQCFDASLYLLMNERKPTWTCPVCDKPALFDHLVIDGYFLEVLSADSQCSEVILHKDGSWTRLQVDEGGKKERETEKENKSEIPVETLIDDVDEDEEELPLVQASSKAKNAPQEVDLITLDSSDDEDPPSVSHVADHPVATGSEEDHSDDEGKNSGNSAADSPESGSSGKDNPSDSSDDVAIVQQPRQTRGPQEIILLDSPAVSPSQSNSPSNIERENSPLAQPSSVINKPSCNSENLSHTAGFPATTHCQASTSATNAATNAATAVVPAKSISLIQESLASNNTCLLPLISTSFPTHFLDVNDASEST